MTGVFIPLALANNPQIGEKYDPRKPVTKIVYLDARKLYGWAMSEYLPTGGFRWVEFSSFADWTEFILNLKDDQDEGYMLMFMK